MSPNPLEAYMLGGMWRALPNDHLDKVVRYANHTGVRSMMVTHARHNAQQLKLYRYRWYQDPRLESKATGLLEKCCDARGGHYALYRFAKLEPSSEAPPAPTRSR
jgi:hypothetical protein